MTTDTAAPYRSGLPSRPERFGQLVHAEWTKLRTVRGWVLGLAAAALVTVAFGLLPGMSGSCGQHGPASACAVPVGPDGELVSDSYYLVHQSLTGNGTITARVTSLTGLIPAFPPAGSGSRHGPQPVVGAGQSGLRPGLVPWAKAGIILTAGTRPGAAYAAMLVTGAHGVRMQDDYTQDIPGRGGAVSPSHPRWLRLTRSGDTLTGYDSADGTHWARVAAVTLAGFPRTVRAGLFATSPQYSQVASLGIVQSGTEGAPSLATGRFDHVRLQASGRAPAGAPVAGAPAQGGGRWAGLSIGGAGNAPADLRGGYRQAGGTFAVTGSGDIAPASPGAAGIGTTVAQALAGTFAALIAVTVVAAVFITSEYRSGLVRVTLTASPRRGRVLAAKAAVIGAVTFAGGLAAAAIVVTLGPRILRDHGVYVFPVSMLTAARVVAGTAALLAAAAILALAAGALLRRSAAAVTAVIVVIVLPYLLTVVAPVLPAGPADWVLRVTPAAAFSVQQVIPSYAQVTNVYTPSQGFFPLAPWAGLAVLCGWAALALGLAAVRLRRHDA
jgi:ABC-type transport system involved in multi-copper enzyme maturation permease subunit